MPTYLMCLYMDEYGLHQPWVLYQPVSNRGNTNNYAISNKNDLQLEYHLKIWCT